MFPLSPLSPRISCNGEVILLVTRVRGRRFQCTDKVDIVKTRWIGFLKGNWAKLVLPYHWAVSPGEGVGGNHRSFSLSQSLSIEVQVTGP